MTSDRGSAGSSRGLTPDSARGLAAPRGVCVLCSWFAWLSEVAPPRAGPSRPPGPVASIGLALSTGDLVTKRPADRLWSTGRSCYGWHQPGSRLVGAYFSRRAASCETAEMLALGLSDQPKLRTGLAQGRHDCRVVAGKAAGSISVARVGHTMTISSPASPLTRRTAMCSAPMAAPRLNQYAPVFSGHLGLSPESASRPGHAAWTSTSP
jgi:hypothetical protein